APGQGPSQQRGVWDGNGTACPNCDRNPCRGPSRPVPDPKVPPYCWVAAPAEACPSADPDAEAEGLLEATAWPLNEEPPAAAELPADPCAAAPPPKEPLIPWPSPLRWPVPLLWPVLLLRPVLLPTPVLLPCPVLPWRPPLPRPLLVAEVPELGNAVEACPVPVSAPLVAPLASSPPSA